ncbi:hypothetical protein BDV59DRAFT_170337 [Aspergillus ambiguus]|uniref:F-box protein n=1 Tax=Aspergillus ambiguus TaxID=176160 RepID=UPI003CCDAF1B
MNPMHQLLLNVKRARASISRGRRKSEATKGNTPRHCAGPSSMSSISVIDKSNLLPTSSPWDILPVELQITIFGHCGIRDLLQLKLVCRAFSRLISSNEHAITRQYLRQRRHGTLPSPVNSDWTSTRNPEDDVVVLSDLFPPTESARGGHLYTFRYVYSLRRRQNLCSKLSYYLADRVMDRFMHEETIYMKAMFPSRKERNAFQKQTVARIWFYITPLMYYTLYFLEAYSRVRREQTLMLLRELEVGKLPALIPPADRKSMYRKLQAQILQSPPFTNNSTLISTHHCLQLLVSYMRYTVPPDEEGPRDDSWIGSLLTVSPFLRIVEYFSAEIGDGGSQRSQRKDFMHNFHHDITTHEEDDMGSLVFERIPNSHLHSSVEDIWFDVATSEMAQRKIAPHHAEIVPVWEGLPILVGCEKCYGSKGWHA